MGGAASSQQVGNHVGSLGAHYQQYATPILEDGVDGELILSLVDGAGGDSDFQDLLDEIGVTNIIHKRKLLNELNKLASAETTPQQRGLNPGRHNPEEITNEYARIVGKLDAFVSHSKKIGSSELRALWAADILEQRGFLSFFDRSDLPIITEEALREKVLNSKCIVFILDPGALRSTWVVKELSWAANAGIPIIPLFDADLYKWEHQLDKWNNVYPWIFQRQAVTVNRSYRRQSTSSLLMAIQKAMEDGLQPPPEPIVVEMRISAQIKVGTSSSLDTETESAIQSAHSALLKKFKTGHTPSLIVASFTCTHDEKAIVQRLDELCPNTVVAGITSCRGIVVNGAWVTHRKEYSLGLWGICDDEGEYAVVHIDDKERENGKIEALIQTKVTAIMPPSEGPPSFVLLLGSPGGEENIMKALSDCIGKNVPILGGSSADNAVLGQWKQIAKVGSNSTFSQKGSTSSGGLVIVLGWCSCNVASTLTSGFYATDKCGTVTKVSDDERTIMEIDNKPAGKVYSDWSDGQLLNGIEYDDKGVANILSSSSMIPLGEKITSSNPETQKLTEYVRVLHPAKLDRESQHVTTFANSYVGMQVYMLSGSVDTVTKKISSCARELLLNDGSRNGGSEKSAFNVDDCVGALMIFCGGLVMAIDSEMPVAVEALAHAVGQEDTMGICCFGEQGMNNRNEAMHGNLMFGALLFSNELRKRYHAEPDLISPFERKGRLSSLHFGRADSVHVGPV